MLAPPRRGSDVHLATCDRCRKATLSLPAPSFDAAREALTAAGWLECARKGVGVKRWEWWCPACRPPAPTSMGPSAGWPPERT